MNNNELKKILKPLIKQCIREVVFEEGILSNLISEVVQGLGAQPITESRNEPPARILEDDTARQKRAKARLQENRKKMLDAIGNTGIGNVDIFEGTEPLTSGGTEKAPSPSSPLSNYAPGDPGVNIEGIMSVANRDWKKFI